MLQVPVSHSNPPILQINISNPLMQPLLNVTNFKFFTHKKHIKYAQSNLLLEHYFKNGVPPSIISYEHLESLYWYS